MVGELAVASRTSVRLDAATREWLETEARERKIGVSTFLREFAVESVKAARLRRNQQQDSETKT
jgi:hypothetical protein